MQQINNKKLGRGIHALLGNNLSVDVIQNAGGTVQEIVKSVKMDKIVAGIYQPRSFFDEEKLANLSTSIATNGVIQPIIVRRADNTKDFYEIIAGERRYRAAKMAGLTEIPAIIKDVSNNKALEFAIIENIQRDDLSAVEEARGYKQLLDEFGYTQEKVANKLGKSRSYVANIVRLLTLPKEVQVMIQEGQISGSHARTLIGKNNSLALAREIASKALSVRDAEEMGDDYEPEVSTENNEAKPAILLDEKELKQRALRKEYLKTVETSLSDILSNLKVRAHYDHKRQKGKVTIFYSDFEEIEKLIKKLEK